MRIYEGTGKDKDRFLRQMNELKIHFDLESDSQLVRQMAQMIYASIQTQESSFSKQEITKFANTTLSTLAREGHYPYMTLGPYRMFCNSFGVQYDINIF